MGAAGKVAAFGIYSDGAVQARTNILRASRKFAGQLYQILFLVTSPTFLSSPLSRDADLVIRQPVVLYSALPITHAARLQRLRIFLSPFLRRILVDRTHPDEAAAYFVSRDRDGSQGTNFPCLLDRVLGRVRARNVCHVRHCGFGGHTNSRRNIAARSIARKPLGVLRHRSGLMQKVQTHLT